ncbi:MAG: hypothetical protein HS108_00460 [Planctomycetes bacterium]|jgi:hypothetical protein|nr:hypothetical protein [Planctomycetota bacterium]
MRLIAPLVVALVALPLGAQVFPRLEKDTVHKRIAGAPAEKEAEPAPDTPRDTVDGEAVLKRYQELLAAMQAGKRDQLKATTRWTDTAHESARKYLEGRAQLRLGFYDDAIKTFDGVGYTVKKEGEIKTQELRNQAAEIKSGKAYLLRMIAVYMQEYRNFRDDAELNAAWEKAGKEADKLRKELQTAIDRKRVDEVGGPLTIREMDGWKIAGKGFWRALWTAEKNVLEKPDNMNSWIALINATGPRDNRSNEEQTPHYLKRRAAAMVVREFWPEALYVKGGFADVILATTHLGAFQCDEFSPYLQPQEYHNLAGRALLAEARKNADGMLDTIKRLRNE